LFLYGGGAPPASAAAASPCGSASSRAPPKHTVARSNLTRRRQARPAQRHRQPQRHDDRVLERPRGVSMRNGSFENTRYGVTSASARVRNPNPPKWPLPELPRAPRATVQKPPCDPSSTGTPWHARLPETIWAGGVSPLRGRLSSVPQPRGPPARCDLEFRPLQPRQQIVFLFLYGGGAPPASAAAASPCGSASSRAPPKHTVAWSNVTRRRQASPAQRHRQPQRRDTGSLSGTTTASSSGHAVSPCGTGASKTPGTA